MLSSFQNDTFQHPTGGTHGLDSYKYGSSYDGLYICTLYTVQCDEMRWTVGKLTLFERL